MALSDRKRIRHAGDVADTLARVAQLLNDPTALEQLRQAAPGPAAMRFDRPIIASSGTSDPTPRSALGRDPLARQLAGLDRMLVQITTLAREMEILLSVTRPPVPPQRG